MYGALVLVAVVALAGVVVNAVLASYSSGMFGGRPGGSSLVVGDYAQYDGRVAVAAGGGALSFANETVRVQVVDFNDTAVGWLQSVVVSGQTTTQNVYWAKAGASPFHVGFVLVKSYNSTRVIGGRTVATTAYVYRVPRSPGNASLTYYCVGGSTFLPAEITSTADGITTSEDIFLTATNMAGAQRQ